MLTIDGLTLARGDRLVLDAVDLDAGPGLTAVLGVNGAGKSTLLEAAAGVLRPRAGTVAVAGQDLHGPGRRQALARVALVPQEIDLPGRLRVGELLAYVGWLRAVPRGRRAARVAAVLDEVGLADRVGSAVGTLSGGMRRRVLIAQALLSEPDVLLLDEPTTGLDPEQRANARGLVASVAATRTVVMASHLVEDVRALADRVVVLHEGRVPFAGTPAEVGALDPTGAGDLEAGFLAVVRGREAA